MAGVAGLIGVNASCITYGKQLFSGTEKKGNALFSFVQVNDTHIHMPDRKSPPYEKDNEKLRHLIDTINKQEKFKLPDFVMLVGDIIHGESLEWFLPECRLAKQMLDALQCPYYTLIGNHEVKQQEGDPQFQGPYEQVFGANRVNYHFVHKGILFVCLNNSGARGYGDRVSEQRNEMLSDVLRTHADMPKIIACHIPMVSLREEQVLRESFGFPTYKMLDDVTWNIVRKERESVIAVLNGHVHLTSAVKVDDIMHISTSGLASYPCDYAHYTVYHDHIDVVMHQLGKDFITPRTNLHGKPRYEYGFTDRDHRTPEEYVAGTKGERRLTIQLSAKKQIRQQNE